MTARLLLVDDHNLFRTGLRLIVQDHPGVGTIAEAGTIADACALQLTEADLVLLDIQLPGMTGLDGLHRQRRRHSGGHHLRTGGPALFSDQQRQQCHHTRSGHPIADGTAARCTVTPVHGQAQQGHCT